MPEKPTACTMHPIKSDIQLPQHYSRVQGSSSAAAASWAPDRGRALNNEVEQMIFHHTAACIRRRHTATINGQLGYADGEADKRQGDSMARAPSSHPDLLINLPSH